MSAAGTLGMVSTPVLVAVAWPYASGSRHLGHLAGDTVLKTVTSELNKKHRVSDFIIRYGGDELMFILPDSPHYETITKAEKIW